MTKQLKRGLVFGVFLVVAASAWTQQMETQSFAAGVSLGQPTGITVKAGVNGPWAVDAAAAWSLLGNAAYLHGSVLNHFTSLDVLKTGSLWVYAGGRAAVDFGVKFGLSALVPVGLSYLLDGFPGEIFLEIAPGLRILPATEFDIGGAVGFRYIFQR